VGSAAKNCSTCQITTFTGQYRRALTLASAKHSPLVCCYFTRKGFSAGRGSVPIVIDEVLVTPPASLLLPGTGKWPRPLPRPGYALMPRTGRCWKLRQFRHVSDPPAGLTWERLAIAPTPPTAPSPLSDRAFEPFGNPTVDRSENGRVGNRSTLKKSRTD
jgi:hypothetical protein